ncbi:hypothetical protein [Chitinophaga pinensis]|uniref:hypothetical protein n=1 Tax=Chitinophaga pinensis TaxID=79329 RepID=UPI0016452816|nr:hypothetical protein [Chitinophaga pinensis]
MDNIRWEDAGAFSLANIKDLQPQFLTTFPAARYLKIVIWKATTVATRIWRN